MISRFRLTPFLLAATLASAAGAAAAQTYQLRVAYPGLKPSTAAPAPAPAPAPAEPPPPALVAQGTLTADTSADFGNLASGTSASRSFTFTNSGTAAATGVAAAIPATAGLVVTANTCGTAAAPVTVDAGHSCRITLSYGGAAQSSLAGSQLAVAGAFASSPAQLALAGTAGGFSAAAAWSSTGGSVVPVTNGYTAFGTKTLGKVHEKAFYLMKSGQGFQSAGFVLSGDTSQFQLVQVRAVINEFNTRTCATGTGVLAADKLSATPCRAETGPNIELKLRYAPTVLGSHSVTLTPLTDNGTALPAPLLITASSQFNPTATWSSSYSAVTPLTDTNRAFGLKGAGSVTPRVLYLFNTGTHGAQSVGFVLSGDTAHFKLTNLYAARTYQTQYCETGGVIAAGGASVTPCLAVDVSSPTPYSLLKLQLDYAPKTAGNHSVTVTPITDNGTALPAAQVFTGSAQFDATAAWSSSWGAVVPLTAADLALGAKTVGTSFLKRLALHNTGTYGNLAVGFVLSGDTAHFTLAKTSKTDRGYLRDCTFGGVLAANQLSTSPCHADEPNQSAYHGIDMGVRYAPKAVGSHSITITPVTDNGTALPGAITLTGSGQ